MTGMRSLRSWFSFALCTAALAESALASDGNTVLFVQGKRVIVRPGEEIENGAVLVRDGRITAVGRDLRKPEGARSIEGAVVCAAYIYAWGALGLGTDSIQDPSTSAATRTVDGL